MIVFNHIPKTAGTSLKYILRRNFGIHHVDTQKTKQQVYTADDLKFARKVFFGVKAISGHNLIDPRVYLNEPGVQLITILRDPVMRCASHYQDHVLRRNERKSFKDWIEDTDQQNLSCKNITGSNDLAKAKKLLKESYVVVGITERFQDTLKLMQILLDESFDLYNIRRITASSNEVKINLLEDEASLKLLKKHNQLDQQLYDFVLEDIFLPSLERYGEQMDSIIIPQLDLNKRNESVRRYSIRYNNYVYRPLIRITGK